jgi:hypothetical protein
MLLFAVATAVACTLIEAISPHGWDNALLQLGPSFMLYLYSSGMI